MMTNNIQKIAESSSRSSLSKTEAAFLSRIASKSIFSIEEARSLIGHSQDQGDPTRQFLHRLQRKGWIRRIRRGLYAVIPLSSGEEPNPQIHEFHVAMELVTPAAIAYWTALNHHGMSEQIPRTVFVATNHPVRYPPGEIWGIPYKIVCLRPARFFGIMTDWIDEREFRITDREKTIVDGLDLPEYVGGVGEIARALSASWDELDEGKLRNYAMRMGNTAVVKRLGYLMESLGLGDPDALRNEASMAPGFSSLDPTLPHRGRYTRRWGLLINSEVER